MQLWTYFKNYTTYYNQILWQSWSCNYCIRGSVNIVESNNEWNENSRTSSRIVRKKGIWVPGDVIECACGYMTSKDAATHNSVINVTILDEGKDKVNLRVNLDQMLQSKKWFV